MKCSNCGAKVKKNSSFCVKCGAKIDPDPKIEAKKQKKEDNKQKKAEKKTANAEKKKVKKEAAQEKKQAAQEKKQAKKQNKQEQKDDKKKGQADAVPEAEGESGKKKRKLPVPPKILLLIPIVLVLVVGILSLFLFGDKFLPNPIKNNKIFVTVSTIVKEKVPNPLEKLGKKDITDETMLMENLSAFLTADGTSATVGAITVDHTEEDAEAKTTTVYLDAEVTNDTGTDTHSYSMVFSSKLIGGWNFESATEYNIKEEPETIVGVENALVLNDPIIYEGLEDGMVASNEEVIGHYTDMTNGTDTVAVYMELKNNVVFMTGSREIVFQYDEATKTWSSSGPAGKFSAWTVLPVEMTGEN